MNRTFMPQNKKSKKKRKLLLLLMIFLWVVVAGLAIFLGLVLLKPEKKAPETMVTMHSLTGVRQVPESKVEDMLSMGWFLDEVMQVYNLEGETRTIEKEDKDDYLANGWYDYKPVKVKHNTTGEEKIIRDDRLKEEIGKGYKEVSNPWSDNSAVESGEEW